MKGICVNCIRSEILPHQTSFNNKHSPSTKYLNQACLHGQTGNPVVDQTLNSPNLSCYFSKLLNCTINE